MSIGDAPNPVLFFDGECNLCNSSVQFVIKRDRKKLFRFAALQSEAGRQALTRYPGRVPDSFVLLYKDRFYVKSDAALLVCRLLGGGMSLLYGFMVVPRFIRNAVYDMVSRNRYRWFGKRNECMIPTPELKSRFLS
jgi:predicted DCC family thiol-disulfide oxidoreductase YuxK